MDALAGVALRFVDPRDGFSLYYLAGAMLFALSVALWRRRARKSLNPRGLLRFLFSRRVALHPSSRLDYRSYVFNSLLVAAVFGVITLTAGASRHGFDAAFDMLGWRGEGHAPAWLAMTLVTVAQVLLVDLLYWGLHYAFHNVPWLWNLHKVHHSAEVMTPFTEWRGHPLEIIGFASLAPIAAGLCLAVGVRLLGRGAVPASVLGMNVFLVAHLMTFHHLRHGQAWIAARGWLGRIVHSPAHHHLHHSTDPAHYGKNLGYALSVWDWAFGTLLVPGKQPRLKFGVPGEPAFTTLAQTIFPRLRYRRGSAAVGELGIEGHAAVHIERGPGHVVGGVGA